MKITTILALLLLSLCCSAHQRESNPRLTATQIDMLAKEALRHTPEYVHSVCVFKWVLYEPPKPDPFPKLTDAINRQLGAKYVVYSDQKQIPADDIYDGNIGKGYLNGFFYTVDVKILAPNEIQVIYSDFEDPLAAGQQTFRYKWQKGKWVETSRSGITVS